jgi:prepilin-type N-terminal cleavage/methylation domain-containing protein
VVIAPIKKAFILEKVNTSGFTLIEILITLVIVGVLAAISLPTYRNYVITAEVTEGLLFADEERIKVELFYEIHGRMPQTSAEAEVGDFPAIDRIQQVIWRPGIRAVPGIPAGDTTHTGRLEIVMNLSDMFGGEQSYLYRVAFYLTARGNQQGAIVWACVPALDTNPHLDPKYLPASCQIN